MMHCDTLERDIKDRGSQQRKPGLGIGHTEENVVIGCKQQHPRGTAAVQDGEKAVSICSTESNILTQGRVFMVFFSC